MARLMVGALLGHLGGPRREISMHFQGGVGRESVRMRVDPGYQASRRGNRGGHILRRPYCSRSIEYRVAAMTKRRDLIQQPLATRMCLHYFISAFGRKSARLGMAASMAIRAI